MRSNKFAPLLLTLALAGCQTMVAPPVVNTAQTPTASADGTTASPTVAPSTAASAAPSPEASASPTPSPSPSETPRSSGGGSRSTPAPVRHMFVMNGLGQTIDDVDLATNLVTMSALSTGLYPNQLLRDGGDTYLVNSGDANLFRLNLLTHQSLEMINLAIGSNPMTLYKTGNSEALVVNYMDSDGDLKADASFLDMPTMTVDAGKTVNFDEGRPAGGALIHGGKAYVPAIAATYGGAPDYLATYTFSGVYVIDLATHALVKTIDLDDDANPGDISLDPASGLINVCVKDGVTLIDPATDDVVAGGLVSSTPIHSIVYVSATLAYAAVYDGLVTFNPSLPQAYIKAPAQKIAAGGDTSVGSFAIQDGKAYVPNFSMDTVTVVDLSTEAILHTFSVGDGPQAVVFQTKP